MIKSYGKEAYYEVEQLKNHRYEESNDFITWQQTFDRRKVSPNTKFDYTPFQVKEQDQIELVLEIQDSSKKIEQVDFIIDHVVLKREKSVEGKTTIKTIFTCLPSSTMQLVFYGDFATETIVLHSSYKGNTILSNASNDKTFYSYTNNHLYTLTLCDNEYYLSSTSLDSVPTGMTYGKTDNSIAHCDSFIVSDFYGDITACVMCLEEGDISLYDLISKKIITITGKEVDSASITISVSAIDPILLLYHGVEGWFVQGISKEFALSQLFSCSSLNTNLQNVKFTSLTGISSTQNTIGANGYIGVSAKGKVIYFRPIYAMMSQDNLRATILNMGNVQGVWGVELDDGIHLVAKEGNMVREYLLTYENEKVKLATIGIFSNAQDMVYSKTNKYVVYLDELFKVEENAE